MTAKTALGPADLRSLISVFSTALIAHKEVINRLNVYPVPDGDTGTNMSLTVGSVLEAIDEAVGPAAADGSGHAGGAGDANSAEPELDAICSAIAKGSLMGARGNSGVILSQLLRGLVGAFSAAGDLAGTDGSAPTAAVIDAGVMAGALDEAQIGAYGAVMKPVEGTILTVVREAAEAAVAAAGAGDSLVAVLDAAKAQGVEALARTPEMLPVLAEAGVVDAGGTGFLLLLDAALHVVDDRPMPEVPTDTAAAKVPVGGAQDVGASPDEHGDISDLRYEVMFLLDAPDDSIDGFKNVWAGLGDSIVVVGGDGLFNCHVHTDDIGAAIEAGIQVGRPHRIRVTDLQEEVEEERWVREAAAAQADDAPEQLDPVPTAVVAVSPGDGITRIFRSLGVQVSVTGGQTMNPSTAQMVEAVEAAPADQVVILPNNGNIIPVAQQVNDNTSKSVVVVPTRGVTEGLAALVTYDPQASAKENAVSMEDAAESVVAAEITQAVRDSSCPVGPIAEGDFLGLVDGEIRTIAGSLVESAVQLLAVAVTDEHEIVSIIEGVGASDATTRSLTLWLEEHRPDVVAEVHHGGQQHYPYYLGIE